MSPRPWQACVLLTLAVFCSMPPLASAGRSNHFTDEEGFAYYDVWWREARADRKTALMLHFGPPREHAWTRPGNAKLEAKDESDEGGLLEGDLAGLADGAGRGEDLLGEFGQAQQTKLEQAAGRDRDAEAPPGKLYDYSPNLRVVELPAGVARTDNGRFGAGLKLSGEVGLRVLIGKKGERKTMDGWFKPAALPEKPVCLLAGGRRGDARLWLLPDGRVQAAWHEDRRDEHRTRITSETKIDAGAWTHIALFESRSHHRPAERHLGVNGRTVARHKKPTVRHRYRPVVSEGSVLYIGESPDDGRAFKGSVDDVRVTTRRRYCPRESWPQFDPAQHPRPIPFGPPVFEEDQRVFHLGFESRKAKVHPTEQDELQWDLGEHAEFADYQIDAPFGKGLLIDPAMGFPRFSIEGLNHKEGTFEFWFQPVNWDNNSSFGERMGWSGRYMSVVRFRGRDKRSGKIVTFMEADLPRASMFSGKGWMQPGTWVHFAWGWSPEDIVTTEGNWGAVKKGDPISGFRATCFGKLQWRAMLRRDVGLLDHVEPLYIEIGIPHSYSVYHGQRPAIMIDEIIYHEQKLTKEQRERATGRWAEQFHPDAE